MNPIEENLEQLQELLDTSKAILFTDAIRVDRGALDEIIYSLRTNIPDSIKEAERVIASCDQFVEDANLRAERILNEANLKAQEMVSGHEVYIRAVDQAEKHFETVNQEIDQFCSDTIKNIDEMLAEASRKISDLNSVMEKQYKEASAVLNEYIEDVYLMRKSLREEQ